MNDPQDPEYKNNECKWDAAEEELTNLLMPKGYDLYFAMTGNGWKESGLGVRDRLEDWIRLKGEVDFDLDEMDREAERGYPY